MSLSWCVVQPSHAFREMLFNAETNEHVQAPQGLVWEVTSVTQVTGEWDANVTLEALRSRRTVKASVLCMPGWERVLQDDDGATMLWTGPRLGATRLGLG